MNCALSKGCTVLFSKTGEQCGKAKDFEERLSSYLLLRAVSVFLLPWCHLILCRLLFSRVCLFRSVLLLSWALWMLCLVFLPACVYRLPCFVSCNTALLAIHDDEKGENGLGRVWWLRGNAGGHKKKDHYLQEVGWMYEVRKKVLHWRYWKKDGMTCPSTSLIGRGSIGMPTFRRGNNSLFVCRNNSSNAAENG